MVQKQRPLERTIVKNSYDEEERNIENGTKSKLRRVRKIDKKKKIFSTNHKAIDARIQKDMNNGNSQKYITDSINTIIDDKSTLRKKSVSHINTNDQVKNSNTSKRVHDDKIESKCM